MANEREIFAREFERPEPVQVAIVVKQVEACDCGCGAAKGVLFLVAGIALRIVDANAIDKLIRTLQEAREKIWGPGGGSKG